MPLIRSLLLLLLPEWGKMYLKSDFLEIPRKVNHFQNETRFLQFVMGTSVCLDRLETSLHYNVVARLTGHVHKPFLCGVNLLPSSNQNNVEENPCICIWFTVVGPRAMKNYISWEYLVISCTNLYNNACASIKKITLYHAMGYPPSLHYGYWKTQIDMNVVSKMNKKASHTVWKRGQLSQWVCHQESYSRPNILSLSILSTQLKATPHE